MKIDNPQLLDSAQPGATFSDITLRDLFAGMAMQGMVDESWVRMPTKDFLPYTETAYTIADEMLKAREGQS